MTSASRYQPCHSGGKHRNFLAVTDRRAITGDGGDGPVTTAGVNLQGFWSKVGGLVLGESGGWNRADDGTMLGERRGKIIVAWCGLIGLAACAGAAVPPITPTSPPPQERSPAPQASTLRAPTTFAELLQARPGQGPQRNDCLLVRKPTGWFLGAPATLATQTWPELPQDLETVEGDPRDRLRILTHWGLIGEAPTGPLLVAATRVTPTAIRAPAMAVFIAAMGGFAVRYSDRQGAQLASVEAVATAARRAAASGNGSLWITAAQNTPVARLRRLLAALPAGVAVAIGIALPPITQSPAGAKPSPIQAHCPDGLSEPVAERAEGDLGTRALLRGLEPLKAAARSCLAGATGAAAGGGRVVVALRINEWGAIDESCLTQDSIGDATMAACLVASAQALRFDTPAPAGFVDVALPLALSPAAEAPQRTLCE